MSSSSFIPKFHVTLLLAACPYQRWQGQVNQVFISLYPLNAQRGEKLQVFYTGMALSTCGVASVMRALMVSPIL